MMRRELGPQRLNSHLLPMHEHAKKSCHYVRKQSLLGEQLFIETAKCNQNSDIARSHIMKLKVS